MRCLPGSWILSAVSARGRTLAFRIGWIEMVCAVEGRMRGSDLILALRPGWTHRWRAAGQPGAITMLVPVMRRQDR